MERSFNTTGPCFADEHHILPPERRLGDVLALIERRKYFVLHAGRQTGKTTSLFWLEEHLPARGMRALCVDVQTARDLRDPARALTVIFRAIQSALEVPHYGLQAADAARAAEWLKVPERAVLEYLRFLSAQDPRPFVLLVDEADCLVGEAMVSFLTQIRDGYIHRKRLPFPSSVALAGIRAVRDFVVPKEQQEAGAWLGTASPFNVSAETTTLSPFTETEVAELLGQHTAATGQRFEPQAVARIWALTEGHPWLTNALADEAVRKLARDRSMPVTTAHVEAAKETILLAAHDVTPADKTSHVAGC